MPTTSSEELGRIADALHAALTGKTDSGAGHIGQATLDHLIALGVEHGLDGLTNAVSEVAEALNRIASAIERLPR